MPTKSEILETIAEPAATVARRLGVSRQRIHQLRKQYGLPTAPPRQRRQPNPRQPAESRNGTTLFVSAECYAALRADGNASRAARQIIAAAPSVAPSYRRGERRGWRKLSLQLTEAEHAALCTLAAGVSFGDWLTAAWETVQ